MSDLLLDGWTVLETRREPDAYKIVARYEIKPEQCTVCGLSEGLHKHDSRAIDYVDAPLHGLPTTITVMTGRYKCLNCKATFMQPLPDMWPDRKLTRRCVDYIARRAGNQTWAKTARELGIDEKTVRELGFEYLVNIADCFEPYAPRILGIDELTLAGQLRIMLVDIDRKQPIDILPVFSKAAVIHWLMWLPRRELIKMVSMDMSSMFHSAVT